VNFKRISVERAMKMMSEQDLVQIVDIRDDQSFLAGHIPDSFQLHGANIDEFMASANPEAPLLVVCYHGISSQSAAAYLAEQGFRDTYSLDGGFEAWLSAQKSSASS
jgi:thiosulfate sulfurtransferase